MSITIRQLAAELGVSREAVRLQVQKLSAADVDKGKNRTTIITDAGADIIREWFKVVATNNNQDTTSSEGEKSYGISKNPIEACKHCKELQQQVTNLQQIAPNLEHVLEAKIQQIKLLSDNIADLRATTERQAAEAERKDTQIEDLLQTIKAQTQTIQAQQIINGKVFQLEAPKRKWYDMFRRNKDTEQQ